MAVNDLAPGFIKVFYTSGSLSHEHIFPIKFDGTPSPGIEPNLQSVSGGVIAAGSGVSGLITVLKAQMPSTATYTGWEVYSKSVGADPTFIFGDDLSIVGTSATAVLLNSMTTASFRTSAGGVMKIVQVDVGITAVNTRTALRVGTAGYPGALATYILGSSAIVYGRDGGRAVSGIYFTTKTNDAIRKKRLLDS